MQLLISLKESSPQEEQKTVYLSSVYYEGFVTLPIKSIEPVNENNINIISVWDDIFQSVVQFKYIN